MRWFIVAAFGLWMAGCCCKGPADSGPTSSAGTSRRSPAAAETPTQVQIGALLTDYKGNEVRADGLYKGKYVEVAGTVDDVKKDILNSMYITLGTGKMFEIPQVQCHLSDEQTAKAAALNKGQRATVRGHVDGLMMHVQIRDCVLQ